MAFPNLFTPETATFIRDVGFPAFAFIVVVLLILYLIKKDTKRQTQSDQNYKELVKEFIDKMDKITKEHTEALNKISTAHIETGGRLEAYTREVSENRELCNRERDRTLGRILEEITELKDEIKDKFRKLESK